MSGLKISDTMPKIGHVTDLREQWLVRTDGALAHHLQDREISSHLCGNRYRNQQIREDFPLALNEQRDIEHQIRLRDVALRHQADVDAEMAREMAEINFRRQRSHRSPELPPPTSQPCSSKAPALLPEIDPEELGLSAAEIEEMKLRLEQEEKDARLAREISHKVQDEDALLADMKCAVEAQDGELARLLQQREYKKLQRAKEKARQKAMLKKQQRIAEQHQFPLPDPPPALCDAYSNPRDLIKENRLRLCKSVDSDLNYVEPFEKEHIQSKESALLSKEISKQYYYEAGTSSTNLNLPHKHSKSLDTEKPNSSIHHRNPPPPPLSGKKPRFPDPVSIRPASHYPTDNILTDADNSNISMQHSFNGNINMYSSTYPPDHAMMQHDTADPSKRLSVISDITAEGLVKRKSKQELQKKKRGCKIQ